MKKEWQELDRQLKEDLKAPLRPPSNQCVDPRYRLLGESAGRTLRDLADKVFREAGR